MHTFNDILDQPSAVDGLRKAYLADRLPHGLLFVGPVGVGKATTAAALAALFLCGHSREGMPCGRCESCRAFEAGTHPDYHVITKELIRYHDKTGKSKGKELSIFVVRPEIIEPANRKPLMGYGKVFVVEQAELMTAAAQNSTLKTLEEPAGRTLIILLTDQPESLLTTIRSRCQTFRFTALPATTIMDQLRAHGIDEAVAMDAAAFSGGSLGIALKWIADGVIEPARQLVEQLTRLVNGEPPEQLAAWFKTAAEAYAEKQMERDELASKDQANRDGLSLYLRLAADHFRSQLALGPSAERLEKACDAIEAIARAEFYLDANVNIPIIFQQLSLSLLRDYAG